MEHLAMNFLSICMLVVFCISGLIDDKTKAIRLFLRGSSQNFGIFFIIGPILLKFSHSM